MHIALCETIHLVDYMGKICLSSPFLALNGRQLVIKIMKMCPIHNFSFVWSTILRKKWTYQHIFSEEVHFGWNIAFLKEIMN